MLAPVLPLARMVLIAETSTELWGRANRVAAWTPTKVVPDVAPFQNSATKIAAVASKVAALPLREQDAAFAAELEEFRATAAQIADVAAQAATPGKKKGARAKKPFASDDAGPNVKLRCSLVWKPRRPMLTSQSDAPRINFARI